MTAIRNLGAGLFIGWEIQLTITNAAQVIPLISEAEL